MTGSVANYIILPDDSGNAGEKIRTQVKTIGGQSVNEHIFVPARQAVLLGVYALTLAQLTAVQNVDNGTSTGSLWFHVPTAISAKKVRLRKLCYSSQMSTALATPTAPRMACSRFTFSGTAAGASLTPVKVDTDYGSPVVDLRTAVTGLTVALVGVMGAMPYCGAVTAVGAYTAPASDLINANSEDEWWCFEPGEGLVIWQDTAGTSADTRKMNVQLLWDEIDIS